MKPGLLTLTQLLTLLHDAPAARFGCGTPLAEGQPADLTAFDLRQSCTVDPERFLSMGRATPFAGQTLYGTCVLTMIGGKPVWKEESL